MRLKDDIEKVTNVDKKYLKFLSDKRGEFERDTIVDITKTSFQADLVSMPIHPVVPYRYILVVVNITNNHLSTVPLENKDAESVKNAFQRLIDRNRLNIKVLQTDQGAEFKGVFKVFCEERNILLLNNNLYNKGTMGIVERMISTLTKGMYEYMAVMTIKEKQTKKGAMEYTKEWVGLLKKVTNEINKYYDNKFHGSKWTMEDIRKQIILHDKQGVYPIGTEVYLRNQKPKSIIDGKTFYGKFRHGDLRFNPTKRKITSYLLKNGRPVRYYLDNDKNVSYLRKDLLDEK